LNHYVALGPVAFVSNEESTFLHKLSNTSLIEDLKSIGVNTFLMPSWLSDRFSSFTCESFPTICSDGNLLFANTHPDIDNIARFPVVMGHFPAGGSLMTMEHWQQMVEN